MSYSEFLEGVVRGWQKNFEVLPIKKEDAQPFQDSPLL